MDPTPIQLTSCSDRDLCTSYMAGDVVGKDASRPQHTLYSCTSYVVGDVVGMDASRPQHTLYSCTSYVVGNVVGMDASRPQHTLYSCTSYVVGDVVGMDASRPQHTLYSLLGYIYGTAEHASFHLQLNLVWLRYLRTTNQLKPALRKAAIGAMNKSERQRPSQ